MKVFKYFAGANVGLIVMALSTTHLTSCVKNVYDTTHVRDTVTDTLTYNDTVCASHCNVDSGMVAFYTFTGGTLADSSGHENNIYFNNAALTADRLGRPNNAFAFDGSSSYMTVRSSASLNPPTAITLSAVVRFDGFNFHSNEILGKGSPDPVKGFYVMRAVDPLNTPYSDPVDVQHMMFLGSFGDNIPQASAPGAAGYGLIIQPGTWYRATYTYDGFQSRIYVDGILVGFTPKADISSGNDQDLFIGRHGDPSYPYYFHGAIDEVRIYDRALSECEVKKLTARLQ